MEDHQEQLHQARHLVLQELHHQVIQGDRLGVEGIAVAEVEEERQMLTSLQQEQDHYQGLI